MKVSQAQLLARVKNLPALPQAVLELVDALRNDGVKSDSIVGLIARDQALTVTALRLANSSFYGVSGRVATLRDAVHILGMNTLSAVMMTAAVMARFERSSCQRFDFDENWRHAIATALCAQMLAQTRGLDACEAYTAGLLHDIGRLALAAHFPEELDAALAWGAEHDAPPIEAERAVMGIDHATAGAMIAAHWRLAPAIAEAIGLHHDVRMTGRTATAAACSTCCTCPTPSCTRSIFRTARRRAFRRSRSPPGSAWTSAPPNCSRCSNASNPACRISEAA